uniref:Uncharacterized protein n=1 Tax=Anguilla anguilla TaxID=7936 RepID=A0A0E9WAA6_ANGAN
MQTELELHLFSAGESHSSGSVGYTVYCQSHGEHKYIVCCCSTQSHREHKYTSTLLLRGGDMDKNIISQFFSGMITIHDTITILFQVGF